MRRRFKRVGMAILVGLPLVAGGCVIEPDLAMPPCPGGVWVRGHREWGGYWQRAHWRCPGPYGRFDMDGDGD